ncbi:helix-turn-helix domain-containing protein [Chloroflexota bacterium]
MKQVELAQQLGISKSYLSMIMSGKRTPNQELARKISSQKVHKSETNSQCKGGALPAELQPRWTEVL